MKINFNLLRTMARELPLSPFNTLPNDAGCRCITGWMLSKAGIKHAEVGKVVQNFGGFSSIPGDEHNATVWEIVGPKLQETFGEDVTLDFVLTLLRINDAFAFTIEGAPGWLNLARRRLVAYLDLCETSGTLYEYELIHETLPAPPEGHPA